jgi:hypothetical protein
VNPKVPYTLDPRKPKSKEMLTALWDEACDLLKPATIHFGCDEMDMRGFPNEDASFVTDLWRLQMPVLKEIAEKHNAQMMLWGDEGLAPGEAVDAMNGQSPGEAAKRRAAIPKGALIADWHYKADPRIETFLPSLQLWKKEGFKPIATAWYQPDNVRSIDLAADVEKCGTLQTTWCGYFSNEQGFIESFEQFSAMVLAADYSWSTRYDSVSKLGYDPGQVLRQMYFGQPRPVSPVAGFQLFQGASKRDLTSGDLRFKLGDPIGLRSLLTAPQAPTAVDLTVAAKGKHIAFAFDTLDQCDEGETIGDLTIRQGGGQVLLHQPLLYGRHVRTASDTAMTPLADRAAGLSIIEFDLPAAADIGAIHIETIAARGGLRLHGIVLW